MLDLLLKNLTVVTMDDENTVLTDACIAVRDGKIDYIGTELPKEEAKRTIDGKGKIATLLAFPSLFKGEHVKHTDMVSIHEGKEISVTFDSPAPLQIDGETILGVTSYKAFAKAKVPEKANT